jgi:hypothetical protein
MWIFPTRKEKEMDTIPFEAYGNNLKRNQFLNFDGFNLPSSFDA